MSTYQGKHYVVVGGSSGIGSAVATALADAGAAVQVWSRSAPTRSGIEWKQWDAIGEDDPPATPDTLDGLVYAPGSIPLAAFKQMAPDQFLQAYRLNVVGAVRAVQACLGAMLEAGGASTVFFGTVAASVGMQFHTSIAAAKAALKGLALSLAAEYAAKRLRFNVVSPSLTDTPLAARLLGSDKKREAADARHPLGRCGTPADVARAALFFLDPDNDWVTGQELGVNGGIGAISGL